MEIPILGVRGRIWNVGVIYFQNMFSFYLPKIIVKIIAKIRLFSNLLGTVRNENATKTVKMSKSVAKIIVFLRKYSTAY